MTLNDLLFPLYPSDGVTRPLNVSSHGFLEVGAAALFFGDVKSKLEDRFQSSTDLLDTEKLLQPSTLTTATSFASTSNHLKAITAYKRAKEGPHKVWYVLKHLIIRG